MTKFKVFYSLVFLLMLASCSGLNNDLILDNKEKSNEANYSEDKTRINCKKKENSLFGLSRTCINQDSFLASLSANPDVGELITSSNKIDVRSNIQGNCNIKENTLFGISRTCKNSAILAESLSN